jgi:D-alanyl-D-alanine carboxypeptidase
MATLARRTVLDFSRYRPYFGLTAATVAGQRIQGHNRLLKSGECTGGKTGYINASGYNLVAWKEQNGRIVIGAVFGGNSISARDRHMASLLRSGFDHTTPIRMAAAAPPPPAPPPERPETVTETVTEAVAEAGLAATAPQIEESEDSRDEDMLDELIVATSTTSPTFDQSWAIQVGAYRDAVQAQQALAQATRSVPVILGAAFPRTIATATTMGQLHRAQLIGLDEQGAKSACATLTRQGMQCLAMPPGQNS